MKLAVILMAVIVGSWLIFDGSRAIVTGEYTTPSSGEYQGQLGPWAWMLSAINISPMRSAVKIAHLVMGALWVGSAFSLYFAGRENSLFVLGIASLVSIWYAPFGTIASVLSICYLYFG